MEALERKNFMDFCQTLDIYLTKVEEQNKKIEKAEAKMKSNGKKK